MITRKLTVRAAKRDGVEGAGDGSDDPCGEVDLADRRSEALGDEAET